MSYEAGRQDESVFITAWSAVDSAMPIMTDDLPLDHNPNWTFNIDTKGLGSRVTVNNDVVTAPDGLSAFWMGDVRTETRSDADGGDNDDWNEFSLAFANNSGAINAGAQDHRRSMADDLCYSIYPSCELTIWKNQRSSGDALALYVRTLGMILEHS